MIRITSGQLKNRMIEVPESARPLTERMRLSLFDLVIDFLPDSNVLDLYAGSGILGFEAMSRGSKSCVFVELDDDAVEIINSNARKLDISNNVSVIKSPVRKYINETKDSKFDLVFIDPPFQEIELINLNALIDLINKESLVVLRIPIELRKENWRAVKKSKFQEVYSKNYGKSEIVFYKPKL